MTKLSVNINKIATIRNARGGNMPNVLDAAKNCEKFGADGITVHPRPDERHIRYSDVFDISPVITTEFNIEGNPINSFIKLVTAVVPTQVTLVPDAHDAITSNAGWDTVKYKDFLSDVVAQFKSYGIRTSIFVDTNPLHIENAALLGADRVELYTEPYATDFPLDPEKAIAPFVKAAEVARDAGLDVNAGHDLNLDNLRFFHENIPWVKEVSIGHALISDALYLGLEKTIQMYKQQLAD
ncbi:MAG: pyridoxine 5'-phosphate synthase [Bacteroidales bacterium]|nr:pyridoxine 5'-phosphate synthase [Bacteroidales bacterium]MBP5709213.1 pyridoxine 5'-phosphate synthase [Bacteroidales bacterium]